MLLRINCLKRSGMFILYRHEDILVNYRLWAHSNSHFRTKFILIVFLGVLDATSFPSSAKVITHQIPNYQGRYPRS